MDIRSPARVTMLGPSPRIPPLPARRPALLARLRVAGLTAAGLLVLSCAAASIAFAANVRPHSSFGAFPDEPVSGQTVRFVSYACDPGGRLTEQAWDLDGDGRFDDASGPSATRTFPAGSHVVGLRVTDNERATAVRSRTLDVAPGRPEYVLLRPFRPPLLSPPPVVRLAGSLMETGVRVRLLTVRAAVCSRITVRCRGRGCPRRRSSKVAGRRKVRFPAFQRRIAAGVVLEVLVRKRDRIGRYTRFRIRRNRSPVRRDLCLRFDDRQGTRCPPD